jgi:hypothetical protein
MIRQKMLALAVGGLAAAIVPLSVQAQSGDALVRAEYACSENGVRPNSVAFDACVNRTARAFARGEPEIAYRMARTAGEARDVCLSYGVPPNTLGYQQCIANAMNSPTAQTHTVRYVPATSDAPRPTAIVDEYGRRYDRYGNRLDQDGYLIMTPVRYITTTP